MSGPLTVAGMFAYDDAGNRFMPPVGTPNGAVLTATGPGSGGWTIPSALPPLGTWTRGCADINGPGVYLASDGILRVDMARAGARVYEAFSIIIGPINSVPFGSSYQVSAGYTIVNPSPCSWAAVHTVGDCYALTFENGTSNRATDLNGAAGVCYENYGGIHGVRCPTSRVDYIPPGGSLPMTFQHGVWEGTPFTAMFVTAHITSIVVNYEI